MNNYKQKLCGIIGYPLKSTLSPLMHNSAFREVGLEWVYLPFPVEKEKVERAILGLKAIGAVGLNVTMPYKETVLPFLDETAKYAQLVGAVNTIHFSDNKIVGYNTDGRGFIDAIEKDLDFNPKDKNFLLIGAGGAARAIAVSLAINGAKSIILYNRTVEKAENIKDLIDQNLPKCQVEVAGVVGSFENQIKKSEMIINATSVGMVGHKEDVPVPLKGIGSKHYIVDIIYNPPQTKFIQEAKKMGAKVTNGLSMLVYQGAASFKIWTNTDAPIQIMREAVSSQIEGAKQIG